MCQGRHTLRLAMLGAVVALAAVTLGISSLAAGVARATSLPSTQDSYPWMLDGNVNALARTGNTVYLGGDFRYLGPRTPGLAKLSAAGTPDTAFPAVNGSVRVVVPDGSGGWYVGGSFSTIGTARRSGLAHVLTNGTVDPGFTADVDTNTGEVRALALAGTTLYVGGSFTSVGGQPRSNLAAVDAGSGALATTWAPDPDSDVLALKTTASKLFVGGTFSTIAGHARAGLAAFATGTGALDSWAPVLSKADVTALEASPTTLYVAGDFTSIGTAERTRLASFDLGSGALEPWAPTSEGPVSNISYAAATDTIYLSGNPHWIANQFTYVIGLDAQTGTAAAPAVPWTATYTVATVSGNTLYIASAFDEDPGNGYDMRTELLGFDLHSGDEVFRALLPASDSGTVRTIAAQGGDVVAGGWFQSIGGVTRDRLAAVDLTTGAPTNWNPGADGTVRALAIGDGDVIAGGDFATVGGAARSRLAALDPASGAATSWHADVSGGNVMALAVVAGTLYTGGSFTGVSGSVRHGAAAIDLTTGDVGPWAPAVSGGSVLAIATDHGTTFLGGSFTAIGAEPHLRLGAVDSAGQPVAGWDSGGDSATLADVRALLLDGGKLFVGGQFQQLDGQRRLDIGALDPATGALLDWDAHFDAGIAVNALATSPGSGEVYAGGSQTPDFWDSDQAIFARLRESDGSKVQDLVPVDSVINAILIDGSSVLIGGSFQWINYHQNHARGFASLTFPPESTSSPTISGVVSAGETLTCATGTWNNSPLTYAYQWRRDGSPIAGQTAVTYVLDPADSGVAVTCSVTARNPGGASTAESGPAGGPPPPANVAAPSVTGTPAYEQQLICDRGSWSGAATSWEYQWLRDGDPIEGLTTDTYLVSGVDSMHRVSCRVVAVGPGGRASALAAPVTLPSPPTSRLAPQVTGTALPGETLTCTPGSWDTTTPVTYTYAWWGGAGMLGTDPDHAVLESERGDSLACVVTARNGGGERTATSNSVSVPLLPPANTGAPRIVGTPLAGRALRCDPGVWTGANRLDYQWTVDGGQRWTPTANAFVPAPEDRGAVLRCTVTAYNANWDSTAADSGPVTVGWDPPAASVGPTVVGGTTPGSTLTCQQGSWSDADSFDVAWLRDAATTVGSGAGYVVTEQDRGHALSCRVTAGGQGGSTVVMSAAVAIPAAPLTPPPPLPPSKPPSGPPPSPPLGGSGRPDTLNGTGAADVIHGLGGADHLSGGGGADTLFGEDGNDLLLGGAGNDLLVGGPGNDQLVGGAGKDTLQGGPGADALDARDGAPGDTLSCGPGRDVVKADRGDRVSRDCEKVIWASRR